MIRHPSSPMAEEEVLVEMEAVQAVYGHDCRVIQEFPLHIHVCIKPRTADDLSQQFVEAVLDIRVGSQYPNEQPQLDILESKGLDGKRQATLVATIRDKAQELSSCLMLISLCEEAVETLSNMNHPDGDCSLCLHPLVPENGIKDSMPFMKLMSCFHCFHSACIVRWWNWLQEQKGNDSGNMEEGALPASRDTYTEQESHTKKTAGTCPICRRVFHAEDIEHVLNLIERSSSSVSYEELEEHEESEILFSEAEHNRRQKFETALKLQQENSGLVEPRKHNVLLPGVFLPERPAPSPTAPTTSTHPEVQDEGCATSENGSEADSSRTSTVRPVNIDSNRRARPRGFRPRNQMSKPSRKQPMKKEFTS